LLVPSQPYDRDVPRFFKQINDMLSCLLGLDRLVGLDPGEHVLQFGG
jgi:hypothetical protein